MAVSEARKLTLHPGQQFDVWRFFGHVDEHAQGITHAGDGARGIHVAGSFAAERNVGGQKHVGIAEGAGALDGVFQFAHIAGPVVSVEHVECVVGKAHLRAAAAGGETMEEKFGEQTYVLSALTERRDVDAHDIEAVEQILAERALGDFFFEVFIGGGEHSHVSFQRLIAPDSGILAFLKHSEQLALHGERHVADFI